MQEFTSAISIACLRSKLLAKLLMHNFAHAKYAKTCNVALVGFYKCRRVENKCTGSHIFNSDILEHISYVWFPQTQTMTAKQKPSSFFFFFFF